MPRGWIPLASEQSVNKTSAYVAEIRVARASLFAAQAIARDLIAAGREKEVQEIRGFISTIVPDPDAPRLEQATHPDPA